MSERWNTVLQLAHARMLAIEPTRGRRGYHARGCERFDTHSSPSVGPCWAASPKLPSRIRSIAQHHTNRNSSSHSPKAWQWPSSRLVIVRSGLRRHL